jgi:energy-coupling factor transport system ATP-binding protein
VIAPTEERAVTLRGLSFWYPEAREAALDSIDLTLKRGEFALLCGPSGGGKSTLLRLLLGLVPQFSGGRLAGTVEVLGRDPTVEPPRRMAAAGVALLFQNPAESFVAQRVGEEVAFGPENLGLAPAEVDARVSQGLAAVGLAGFEERRTLALSVGQQQRVALAAVLALRPALLLLDEPTAHLDEHTARSILALVAHLHRSMDLTVLLGEHRLGLAAPLARRAIVMARGAIVADGPPRDVFGETSLLTIGVPVPRATQIAARMGIEKPLPLTPMELVERIAGSAGHLLPCLAGTARGSPYHESRSHMDGPAVAFESVSFTYGSRATPEAGDSLGVTDLDFALHPGEGVAVMGPSGAGKSTLARLALGLLRPDSGRVVLGGHDTAQTLLGTLAQMGGLVLQNPLHQLFAERVDQELLLGLLHLPAAEAQRRVDAMLVQLGLSAMRDRHPLTLSEGQRRRVALGAVLVREPSVVVMDEPTLGQDEIGRTTLVEITRGLVQKGATVLAISHDPEFVFDACDRVLVLDSGRLTADLPLSTARRALERLAATGVPLADRPLTVLELARRDQAARRTGS